MYLLEESSSLLSSIRQVIPSLGIFFILFIRSLLSVYNLISTEYEIDYIIYVFF